MAGRRSATEPPRAQTRSPSRRRRPPSPIPPRRRRRRPLRPRRRPPGPRPRKFLRQYELIDRVQRLRSQRRRGPAQPRLRLRHAHARLADARLGRSLFRPPHRGGRHPHRLQAGHGDHRHRPAARRDRGHRGQPRGDRPTMFGEEIGELVEGVTKLSRLEATAEHKRQAENLRKFILADLPRRPRAAGQAGRPAAQHAHPAFHAKRGQARAHRPRDPGHLRARWPAPSAATASAPSWRSWRSSHLNPVARDAIVRRLDALRAGQGKAVAMVSEEIVGATGRGGRSGPGLRPGEERPIRSGASCSANRSASPSCPTSTPSA